MVNGSNINVFKMNDETALDYLPAKIYTLKYDDFFGYFLEITKDKLELPKKIYGKAMERVNKCLQTYQERTASTGILLTGDKGTGKSLLMSLLANEAINELGLPVILIKDPFHGTQFISFIESLDECCLVFDEFGKMYVSDDRHTNNNEVPQKALLSLMDGVDKTKRLIIMTENQEFDINEFMLNRPSRIYYHFRYRKLDEESIIGYCKDHDVDKQNIKKIVELSRRSAIFSFDMLQSIVEEHLRFDASIEDATADLNIDLREELGSMLEIIKVIEKATEKVREVYETPFIKKPGDYIDIKIKADNTIPRGTNDSTIRAKCDEDEDEDDDAKYDSFYLNAADLAYEHDGKLFYETKLYTVIAKDMPKKHINYMSLL